MRAALLASLAVLLPAPAFALEPIGEAGPAAPEPPAGDSLPLPDSPVPGVRLVVGGDALVGAFPSALGGEAGGAAEYLALRVGVELPAGLLRVAPEAGAGLSFLVQSTGCFDAFGGLRLSLALPVKPFVFAHAGWGTWAARMFDPQGPYDIDGYSDVVTHRGAAVRGGGGVMVKLFHGQVQAGLQVMATRFLGGSTDFSARVGSRDREGLSRIGWISGGLVVEMAP